MGSAQWPTHICLFPIRTTWRLNSCHTPSRQLVTASQNLKQTCRGGFFPSVQGLSTAEILVCVEIFSGEGIVLFFATNEIRWSVGIITCRSRIICIIQRSHLGLWGCVSSFLCLHKIYIHTYMYTYMCMNMCIHNSYSMCITVCNSACQCRKNGVGKAF